MAVRISTEARNAATDAVVDLIDAAVGNGTIVIRTGTQPASPQVAATGTTLATLTFSDPAFGDAATGQATANAITSDTNVDANGTAGWARIYNADGADPGDAVFDVDIGQGSGTLSFDNTTFVIGATAAITTMTITMPES